MKQVNKKLVADLNTEVDALTVKINELKEQLKAEACPFEKGDIVVFRREKLIFEAPQTVWGTTFSIFTAFKIKVNGEPYKSPTTFWDWNNDCKLAD